MPDRIRAAAVAGTWYPGTSDLLAAAVDGHLAAAGADASPLHHLAAIVAPHVMIVPLLMGSQTRDTIHALAAALGVALRGRRALLVASTDLSHYQDAGTAALLDAIVIDHVERFDPEGLQRALDASPGHACGGGPLVSVMVAARTLGARDAVVLRYGDSGDVSGDKTAVVGYLAAAFGTRQKDEAGA